MANQEYPHARSVFAVLKESLQFSLIVCGDLCQRHLQTNKKLFSSVEISFSNYWPKIENYSNRVNIERSAMCYISIDSTRQALQTNVKLFSNFGIIFRISYNFFK